MAAKRDAEAKHKEAQAEIRRQKQEREEIEALLAGLKLDRVEGQRKLEDI